MEFKRAPSKWMKILEAGTPLLSKENHKFYQLVWLISLNASMSSVKNWPEVKRERGTEGGEVQVPVWSTTGYVAQNIERTLSLSLPYSLTWAQLHSTFVSNSNILCTISVLSAMHWFTSHRKYSCPELEEDNEAQAFSSETFLLSKGSQNCLTCSSADKDYEQSSSEN